MFLEGRVRGEREREELVCHGGCEYVGDEGRGGCGGGCSLDWTHVKLISSGLCFWTRLELVCLANDVPSACTTHSPRLSYCLPPSFPLLSLSLCYQPPTIHPPPPPTPTLCFSLCHLSLPSLSVLGACVLAGLFEIWCQIGGPSARWHRLSQWLEKESGEEERDRVGEKEGGKRSGTRVCQRSRTLFQH